jgi:hypothetical protein
LLLLIYFSSHAFIKALKYFNQKLVVQNLSFCFDEFFLKIFFKTLLCFATPLKAAENRILIHKFANKKILFIFLFKKLIFHKYFGLLIIHNQSFAPKTLNSSSCLILIF